MLLQLSVRYESTLHRQLLQWLGKSMHRVRVHRGEKQPVRKLHVLLAHHLRALVRAQQVSPLALHLFVQPNVLQLRLYVLVKLFDEEFEQVGDLVLRFHHAVATALRQLLTRSHHVISQH